MGSREERIRIYKDLEPDDHVMTLDDFRETVKSGGFIDYDGYASPMKDGKVHQVVVYPSDVPFFNFEDFTHIVWYNR